MTITAGLLPLTLLSMLNLRVVVSAVFGFDPMS